MAFEDKIEEINQRISEETDNEIISLLNKMLITYTDLQRNQKRYGRHMDQMLKPLNNIESVINKRKEELFKQNIIKPIKEKIIVKYNIEKEKNEILKPIKEKNIKNKKKRKINRKTNKIDSVFVLCTYFGVRKNFPKNCKDVINVLYDYLNYLLNFDFGISCDLLVVVHDVTTIKDFDSIISEKNKNLLFKSKEILNTYNNKKLLNGGKITICYRDWCEGKYASRGSCNYVFENYKDKYNYWFFCEEDQKIIYEGLFKKMIDELEEDEKICFVSLYNNGLFSPGGVTSTKYLEIMYNKLGGRLLFGNDGPGRDLQIRMVNQDETVSGDGGFLNFWLNNICYGEEHKWNKFWNNLGYKMILTKYGGNINNIIFQYRGWRPEKDVLE